MTRSSCRVGLVLALWAAAGIVASAQSMVSASLTGVVRDEAGHALPGAAVEARREGGGTGGRTVTDAVGAFSFSPITTGTYTVIVAHAGYTTSVSKGVKVSPDAPAKLTIALETANQLQALSALMPAPIAPDRIDRLPYPTRNLLDAVTLLPGVDTTSVARRSTLAGLPQSTLAITMDGVDVQDSDRKTTDGFFARIPLRQDAMGTVTVTSATPTASAAGQGAARIQFVTRSGTERYLGTVYEYYRNARLNSNSFFTRATGLPKDQATRNEFGASAGGPVRPGRTKAFFFVNYDESRESGRFSRASTILQAQAQAGLFSYRVMSGGVQTIRTVDLFSLAAANGALATADPTVAALLSQIRAATATTGVVTANGGDPLTSRYVAQDPVHRVDRLPTARLDVNLGAAARLSATYARQDQTSDQAAGAAFPGFSNHGSESTVRTLTQATLHMSFGDHVMNEVRVGGAWGPVSFGADVTPAQFASQGGFDLALPLVSSATATNRSSRRENTNWSIGEALTWTRGRQAFTFGGDFTRLDLRSASRTMVPTVTFGIDTLDPAGALFTQANFAGASSADLANARSLYALLVGSVNGVGGNVGLNAGTGQYDPFGEVVVRARQDVGGLFTQYVWRPSSTVTFDAGLRWELQRPFEARDSAFATATIADICGVSGQGQGAHGRACNLFLPGTLTGVSPQFTALGAGRTTYNIDYKNLAPSLGLAWRPNVVSGPMRGLLGDPGQATFRMAYSVAYSRNGLSEFVDLYGANPGAMVTLNRSAEAGNLLTSGGTLPLLLRMPSLLGLPPACTGTLVPPACTPASPSYPLAATDQSINILDPNLKVPFTRSYMVGFERSLGRDTTLELRYVGTRDHRTWMTENWNELNLIESGFLGEYRFAQANLASNLAAGRGATFQYAGPGTNTTPLPIYLAFLDGHPAASAGDATLYTGSGWSNPVLLSRLSVMMPDPTGALQDLWGDAGRRANALGSGLSANEFVMNPDIGANAANVTRSAGGTQYDSLQIAMRRRLSQGLSVAANYTFATRWATTLDSVRTAPYLARSLDVVPHALKFDWTYEIPFGRGRRFGADAGRWMDGLLGGWEWNGTGRVQSGRLLALSGVRLVGMTQEELQREFHVRIAPDQTVTMLPSDIILNTQRAFSPDPTSTTGYSALGVPVGRYISPASTATCIEITPGDCGEAKRVYVTGPLVTRVDMSLRKTIPVGARRAVQVEFDLLNAFNAINFLPVFQAGASATLSQVTSSYHDTGATFDPGGRVGQLMFRIKW